MLAGRPWQSFCAVCLVTSIWAPPFFVLLLCTIGAGALHGPGLGVLLFLWTFCGFGSTKYFWQQVLVVSLPAALAATAPPSWGRLVAAVSVAGILAYGWGCAGEEPYRPRPAVYDFCCKWLRQWFAQAEVRGDLPDGCTSKCCFTFHPHGIICIGFNANGLWARDDFEKAGRINWLVAFRLRYCIPTFRWLCDAITSDRVQIRDGRASYLKQIMEAGENIAVVAGGASEVSAYTYGKDHTDMKRRKGLVKYCLQYGYRMFPIYSFGETTTYKSWSGLPETRLSIAQVTGMPPVFFWGWPWLLTWVPRPEARVITYIGAGIDLPHIPDPAQEDIDQWHGKYLEALTKLFYDNRKEAGFPDAELEIL